MTATAQKRLWKKICRLRAQAMDLEKQLPVEMDNFKANALRKAASIIDHMEGLSNEVVARRVGVYPRTFKRHYRHDLFAMGYETRPDGHGRKGGWFKRRPKIGGENATCAT